MTTIVLQSADALIGVGARTATSLLESAVSAALAGSSRPAIRSVEGPRVTEMAGLVSTEGAPIPRVYGRARVGGQLIWATRFAEVATRQASVERQPSRGGKGFGSSSAARVTTTTSYAYTANLAIGLCEGSVAFIRRVWADAQELDLTTITWRLHRGGPDQEPDPLIVAKEGVENAPAYRGLAYVVFEGLPLAPFGNRVPQFSFEVVRPLDGLRQAVRSVCLVPGSTEFGYDVVSVAQDLGLGATRPENTHQLQRPTDVEASLDQLQVLCPGLRSVSLVVAWFGDDLRAGTCTVAPRVDLAGKATVGGEWRVSGLSRSAAVETSRVGEGAAYGGTPSDASVVRLIRHLKQRGLAVTLYPFLMMDIPAGNALPDPRTGGTGQPAYPWRGRITCDPAPGRPGSADGSAAASVQVSAFFGTAAAADFTLSGDVVAYAGPAEWSFRRLVLHCAALALAAGGVDAFVVGSELVGLTRVRGADGTYPAVTALRALAADVRAVLGPGTRLTYAADWTEYGAHASAGGAEVRFPLDPLWADPAIDAVGIDFYPPISDWRDGPVHADRELARGACDPDYLCDRVGAGEAFDWFYADEAARAAQLRAPITDGAYGKPWVFRAKDLLNWWSNVHVERQDGVETVPTAWLPGSKPIWLTEIGVPAVDKGPNGPNVFPDPKSAESASPPFSSGGRDDLAQTRGLEAILRRFDHRTPGHRPADNPVDPLSGQRPVDPDAISVWCWDARPFPAFPDFGTVWADGPNWAAGHWVTGRLEGAPLDRLVAAIVDDYGLARPDRLPLDGWADGYVIDRPMSAREALEPLARLYGFDAVASGAGVRWQQRGGAPALLLTRADLVEAGEEPLLTQARAQETELPRTVSIGFLDGEGDYARASAVASRAAGTSRRDAALDVAVVTRPADVERLAGAWLGSVWAARESAGFTLSPRLVGLEPGDVIALEGVPDLLEVSRIVDGAARQVSARALDPSTFAAPAMMTARVRPTRPPAIPGRPAALFLDLPAASDAPPLQFLAVAADPWPGAMAVWRSADGESFALHDVVELPAVIGRTLTPFPPGPVWRSDRTTTVDVLLSGGSLASIGWRAALAGGNLLAVLGPEGAGEVVSVAFAELIGPRSFRLSGFVRGLGGTEDLAGRSLPAGATLVRLDEALRPVTTSLSDIGRTWRYRIGPVDRDHADPTCLALDAAVGATALWPPWPVHLRARRSGAGVEIGWVRRTRSGGDGWAMLAVPLGEEDERYEVDVLRDGAAVRTLASAAPSCLYPAAAELADFGAPQAVLTVAVAQLSRVVGRGRTRQASLPVL